MSNIKVTNMKNTAGKSDSTLPDSKSAQRKKKRRKSLISPKAKAAFGISG